MKDRYNLLFPEWQGYGANQDVFHGAHHLCNHLRSKVDFDEVHVRDSETLKEEGKIIGRSSLLNLLDSAHRALAAAEPDHLFMVGGTCACEVAPISFLNKKYDNDLAVFWFDAHSDLNTPDSSPSHRMHGMPLRSLLGEGDLEILKRIPRVLSVEQVALVGSRDLDRVEKEFVEEHRVPIFRPGTKSHASALVDFAKASGFSKAYIHFDLDVLEPSEFPHVLVPTPDGLSLNVAIESLQLVRENFKVVGCSIVEYCPKQGGGLPELMRLVEGMGLDSGF